MDASGVRVEVLGTEFNVISYDRDSFVEVALTSGEVAVSSHEENITLHPREKVVIDKAAQEMERSVIGEGEVLRLRGLNLSLDGHSLDEAFSMINQFFGVRIVIEDESDLDDDLVISFDDDATLETAMGLLSMTNGGFDYRIEPDNTVKITKRK